MVVLWHTNKPNLQIEMKKAILQGVITLALFFSIWFGLMKIDWVSIFKVRTITDKTEEKLGDIFWKSVQQSEVENTNSYVVNSIDSLVTKICLSNDIDRQTIKVHIFENEEINAFALPNGHLVIYTGLILNSESQEELSGVICHEIAHIQLNHVMKKLVKEIGLAAIISISTGGGSSEIAKATVKMLSSSAFDRSLAKEADIKAVDYLVNAQINPEPFANFLYKLAINENQASAYWQWISTHPDSKERSKYIIEYISTNKVKYKSILSASTWDQLNASLKK